jgi:hypothetical protein
MSETPRYIAVEGIRASVISRCGDAKCDDYHEWITLDSRSSSFDARDIARAMNAAEPKPLIVRDNPPMPSDQRLNELFTWAKNSSEVGSTIEVGLRAVWRAGCDAGMVAP